MENSIAKTTQKQRITSKLHYDTCEEYRKMKNARDNAYNKQRYSTEPEFREKRLAYLKNKRTEPEFRAKSVARVKARRQAKRNSKG